MFREFIARDFSDLDPRGRANEGFFDWVDHLESAIPRHHKLLLADLAANPL